MIVNNNINEYNELIKYSAVDYFTYVEAVKRNIAKMERGQSKN